jgi:hypothetical protein
MAPINATKATPRAVDIGQISPPIMGPEPPRIMFEGDWGARMVDGLDRTFPITMLQPERRMSLFHTMQKSRAFRSEMAVPQLSPEAKARLNSEVTIAPQKGSPLRPKLARGITAPVVPTVREEEGVPNFRAIGTEKHAPIFRDPFMTIEEEPAQEGLVQDPESPEGTKLPPFEGPPAQEIGPPKLLRRKAVRYPFPMT